MADFDKWDDKLEGKLSDDMRMALNKYSVLIPIAAFVIGFVLGALVL